MTTAVKLTARQRNLLGYIASEEQTNEGVAFDALYYVNPPIRSRGIRKVVHALVDLGLIKSGPWEGPDDGLLLTITPEGAAAALDDQQGTPRG